MFFTFFIILSKSDANFCFTDPGHQHECTLSQNQQINEQNLDILYENLNNNQEVNLEFILGYQNPCTLDLSKAAPNQWKARINIFGKNLNSLILNLPNSPVILSSLCIENMTLTINSAGSSSKIQIQNNFTIFNCEITGKVDISTNHFVTDILSFYQCQTVTFYDGIFYQMDDSQIIPENTTFEFTVSPENLITFIGFSQDVNFTQDDNKTIFEFTNIDSSIIINTMTIKKTCFPTSSFYIKRMNLTKIFYTDLYVENGCAIQIMDNSSYDVNSLIIHSTTGGNITLCDTSNIETDH